MKKVLFFVLIIALVICFTAMMSSAALAADEATDVNTALDIPYININVAAVVGVFFAMLVLATIIETIAEWIKSALPKSLPKWAWLLITSTMGIGCSILFGVNFFAAVGFTGGMVAVIVGEVFTGVAIGAGSSFIHKLQAKMDAVKSTGNFLTAVTNVNNDAANDSGQNSTG